MLENPSEKRALKSWQILIIILNNQLKDAKEKANTNNPEDMNLPLIQNELEKSINSDELETFTDFFQETKNEAISDFEKAIINESQYPPEIIHYFMSETLKKVI